MIATNREIEELQAQAVFIDGKEDLRLLRRRLARVYLREGV